MQMKQFKKLLSFIACFVLIAAVALFITSCKDNTNLSDVSPQIEASSLGEGDKQFSFCVADAQGTQWLFEIHTNKTTVGEALMELGLIEGEQGPYGLYVKKVNGIALSYEKDGKYWAFFINGEYATSGVDMTEIDENAEYMFKAQ